MAFDLLVVMGATEIHGTLSLYTDQLRSANIEHTVIDCSDKPNINGGGSLGYRVHLFRKYAEHYHYYKLIIFSDAFDVTFYGKSAEDVTSRIPTGHLLHAAEKNCYPNPAIAAHISGDSPWRFANGGVVAGTPAAYLDWCDRAERHQAYNPHMLDQEFLNILVAEGSDLAVLDTKTTLYFCLFGGYDELQFVNGEPANSLYETAPLFLHANGQWTAEEMFDRHTRSLQ